MASQRNAVRAGIFMLASVVAAVMFIIAIAGTSTFFTTYRHYPVIFALQDDVGGLRRGDDVRLGGLKVGSVEELRFVKAGSEGAGQPAADSIVVSIEVPAQYPIKTDAKVNVQSTLTGVTSINISDLGRGVDPVEGQYLQGSPDAMTVFTRSLGEDSPKLTADLDEGGATLRTIRRVGETVGEDVHDTITFDVRPRLRDVSESAIGALNSIHDMLGPST